MILKKTLRTVWNQYKLCKVDWIDELFFFMCVHPRRRCWLSNSSVNLCFTFFRRTVLPQAFSYILQMLLFKGSLLHSSTFWHWCIIWLSQRRKKKGCRSLLRKSLNPFTGFFCVIYCLFVFRWLHYDLWLQLLIVWVCLIEQLTSA